MDKAINLVRRLKAAGILSNIDKFMYQLLYNKYTEAGPVLFINTTFIDGAHRLNAINKRNTLLDFLNDVPEFPKSMSIAINKEQAIELLNSNAENRRPLNPEWVECWANTINAGEFVSNDTDRLMYIDTNNELLDGGQRLQGFVQSNAETISVYFTRFVD